MKQVEIEVEKRTGMGSAETRRLRRQGLVPSVVYAHGNECIPIVMNGNKFIQIASTTRSSQIFTLKSHDKALDGRPAVVKEVQRDYIKNVVLHVDFQAIREDEEVTLNVPIRVVGEAPGVKVDGGILTVVAHELSVRALPKSIPSEIAVDVSELKIGNNIHASLVKLPEGVKLAGNPEETVVSVVAIRVVEEEVATPTAGAAAEGAAAAAPAAGEAAAGAAPAAADAAGKDDKKAGKAEAKK